MQITEHFDDVGPGWRKILEELHANLIGWAPNYQVDQVKEKFGGLRVYLTYNQLSMVTDMERAVGYAEQQSLKTCEMCGAAGINQKTSSGWWKTLCSTCFQIKAHLRNRD